MIIKGAEPFFLQGNSSGVLLVHGFTGLPTELLLLGEYLNRAGFTVLGVRLAGHATTAEDLSRTTREDWFNSVLDGYSILRGVCKNIFVVGHSMGSLLALKLTTFRAVDKAVTIAAPMFVDDSLGAENLPPREKCAGLFVDISRKKLHDVPQAANHTYKRMPLLSVHELFDLIDETKKLLPRVTTPLLVIHAQDDHTARPASAKFIVEATRSRLILVESGGHLLPLTENREFVFEEIVKFLVRK